jgi:hypothetical protein
MKMLQINTVACDGSDVFWPWFLWLLGAFILGFILGWLLKQIFGGAAAVKEEPANNYKEDLTKIEGIGEKIEELLNKDGIYNYHQLALASNAELQKVLVDAGPAYAMHRPRTWSAQARLADEGQWEELEKWQEMLKGGV